MRTAIGVDLGGSHTTAAVIGEDGSIHKQHEKDLDDLSFDAVIAALVEVISAALKDPDAKNVVGIGIGSPGNVEPRSGAILYSPNFRWTNVPIGETVR